MFAPAPGAFAPGGRVGVLSSLHADPASGPAPPAAGPAGADDIDEVNIMLNIFYGRESIDKEKFIYEKIAEKQARTLVIVPDQYTLEGEKQAFRLLRTQGLMDVEIISMSRLGGRLLAEQGGGSRTFIDKYGRHMLLTQILRRQEENLQVFRGAAVRNSFIEMTNNFISEMKQYNVTPQDLAELTSGVEPDSLLARKLSDLQLIFSAYEEKISGKYTDSEDYIDLYMSKISSSALIRGATIWVYGFDSFAPKALGVLGHLMAVAEEVNVFLTYDRDCLDEEIFRLPEIVMANLEKQAEAFGISHGRHKVGAEYRFSDKAPAVRTIEEQIFAAAKHPSRDSQGLTVVEAANMYSEAESAASFILDLLRNKGLRYRDIVVICNDQNVRGSIIGRVFGEYGIALFDDKKRSIMNSPIAIFVVALLETAAGGYRTQDIFKLLKTGFAPISDDEIEELENYAIKYRVKGSMWKKPFVRGQLEYGADGLEEMNRIREAAMALFMDFESVYRDAPTVGVFIEQFYDFLIERAALGNKILDLIEIQEERGLLDLAEETRQIWGQIVGLFDQIAELSGDEKLSGRELTELLVTGLSQLEVGVLPPTSDDILMGTMQRSRSGQVKAMLVIGANEGLLPASVADDGLFSIEELEFLAEEGQEICKVEKIRLLEEKLAIYRNLSKPSDYLWISYAASDEEGKEIRPSEILDSLCRIFPGLHVEKDVLNCGDMKAVLGGRVNTLRHLTQALQEGRKGEKIPVAWKDVYGWYLEHDRERLDMVRGGLEFTNTQKDLPKGMAELLYKRDAAVGIGAGNGDGLEAGDSLGASDGAPLVLSPSRLEKFSRCPFAHFVAYGLRPEERRIYEAAGREVGDIYHKCLMEISGKLTKENTWDKITEEECREFVVQTVEAEAQDYREGLFHFSNEEKYKQSRIEDTCFYVCWALIEQVRMGQIKESLYEVPFGRGRSIPPVEVSCDGEKVYIEGKIDRLDTLADDRVKIIDYKTGRESFNTEEARAGYRLQLMLYLKAAQKKERKPAGVFYFLIDDPQVDLTGENTEAEKISEKISKEMRKSFKLNGIMVNDDNVISGIAGEFEGVSDIVPLRRNKDGTVKGTSSGVLLSEEEFEVPQTDVDRQIEKLCGQLKDGRIAIQPKKTDKESACKYCQYKGICRFDLNFPGCNFEVIK